MAWLTFAATLCIFPTCSHGDIAFVSNWSTIEEYDLSSGKDLGVFTSGLNGADGLAFDAEGNLYAAMYGANTIMKFTSGGVGSLFASTGLSGPVGLAFDNSGNLYVANHDNNTIEEFTPGGIGSVFANTGLSRPMGLAFDSGGNLYAANYHNGASPDSWIEEITPSGVGSVFATTGLDNPSGLAFDSAGNLYAANFGAFTIERFTADGSGSLFADNGLRGPYGLAFDSTGNLYAPNWYYSNIEEFNSSGIGSVFASGLSNPYFIAIEVAEPSAWSLFGFGLTAFVAFLRSKALRVKLTEFRRGLHGLSSSKTMPPGPAQEPPATAL